MKGKRVYLRALEPDDYKTSVAWRNDDEISGMLSGQKFFVSAENEKHWVADAVYNEKNVRLAVCTIEDDKYIGNVYLTDLNMVNRCAHSHVLIGDKDYWSHGYGSEALRLLMDYAFNELGLNRIEAGIIDTNIASLKMHEKCGYKVEGVKRQAIFKRGHFHDHTVLSILREEYESINETNK